MSKKIVENIKANLNPSDELMRSTKEQVNSVHCEQSGRRAMNRMAVAATCFVIVAAIAVPWTFSYFNNNQGITPNDHPSPLESNQPIKDKTLFTNLSIVAYSPQKPGQVFTADYLNETTATKLIPNTTVLMENFSPLSSAIPGYPIKFEIDQSDKNTGYEIIVTTDNGELMNRDARTGDVSNHGKQCKLYQTETLFWSPFTDQKAAANAAITVSIIQKEKILGKQVINIYEKNSLYYIVANKIETL